MLGFSCDFETFVGDAVANAIDETTAVDSSGVGLSTRELPHRGVVGEGAKVESARPGTPCASDVDAEPSAQPRSGIQRATASRAYRVVTAVATGTTPHRLDGSGHDRSRRRDLARGESVRAW
ncbi:hypothetical protein [Agromyces larvae]|uniref:ATP-binding protein n=1 Tax=Agromyces larvae TaxID=2929802 RepID=A0ABY4C1S7_9MICO|nr:hypothetical protein [Agromyces larvae]UOE45428.1 hypothetical protein MTO99_06625 [Agromyces larvae]